MAYSFDKAKWEKSKVKFEQDEEILSVAGFHKNPNLAQIVIWRAMSPGLTTNYIVLLTNLRAVIVPIANSLKPKILYIPFENIKVIQEDGAMEIDAKDGKKPLRIYPDSFANKLGKANMEDFVQILKSLGAG